jgi:meso-butanediol dehydrogenase/(S,S)-butanediol dehydrogenase/diacetyl reductase
MPVRLAGKIAVITGAAGGIGRACVEAFHAEGAGVVAMDLNEEGRQEGDGCTELALTVDVTREEAVITAFERVERELGRLDVLVNVAGGSGRRFGDGPVDVCTAEGWSRTLDLNLVSVFLCCKHAVPLMRRAGGGSIVNTGSVLGMAGHELFATHAYAAAKGAVISLTRAMAVHYAPERIRVNVLCPGLIRTAMSLRAQEDPATLEALAALQPLTRGFGEPTDVAAAAVFLASDDSRFITGAVLPVDGGWTAR